MPSCFSLSPISLALTFWTYSFAHAQNTSRYSIVVIAVVPISVLIRMDCRLKTFVSKNVYFLYKTCHSEA
ncbi:hypothetical protein GcM1_c15380o21 [Golovinomyces cichoracearum]|uniref:Secreted protein n=1 Tax=Golovinomyces cichoracearum TaxID=62708 RepID=A0A420IMT2_9PEZI|nr:hypothetical protein GcM1_c15380o21 [Golovinomyces cichoracearum]